MKKLSIFFLLFSFTLVAMQGNTKRITDPDIFAKEIKLREIAFINSAGLLYLFFKSHTNVVDQPRDLVHVGLMQDNAFDALYRFILSYKSRNVPLSQCVASIKRMDDNKELDNKMWRNIVGFFEFLQQAKILLYPVRSPLEIIGRLYATTNDTQNEFSYYLIDLIRARNEKVLAAYCKKGDVNSCIKCKCFPLLYAVLFDSLAMTKTLLDHKADVNMMDQCGVMPLLCARSAHVKKLLLDENADVNASNMYHQTPLMIAAYRGKVHSLQALIALKADVSAQDKVNQTALTYSLLSSPVCPSSVEVLCRAHADLSIECDGKTPYEYMQAELIRTKKFGQPDPTIKKVLKILESYGALEIQQKRPVLAPEPKTLSHGQKMRQLTRKFDREHEKVEQEILEKFKGFLDQFSKKRTNKAMRNVLKNWQDVCIGQQLLKRAKKYDTFCLQLRGFTALRNFVQQSKRHKLRKSILSLLHEFYCHQEFHNFYALHNACNCYKLYQDASSPEHVLTFARNQCANTAQKYIHFFKDHGYELSHIMQDLKRDDDREQKKTKHTMPHTPWVLLNKAYMASKAKDDQYSSVQDMCKALYEASDENNKEDLSSDEPTITLDTLTDIYFGRFLDCLGARDFSRSQRMIMQSADVATKKNKDGVTALHVAVFNNFHEIVPCLLSNGAQRSCKDKNGVSPLDLARTDVIKKLLTTT